MNSMIKLTISIFSMLTLMASFTATAQTVYVRNLAELSWNYRVILLNGDALPAETLSELSAQNNAINERQIVWLWQQNNKIKSNSMGTFSELTLTQIAQQLTAHNVVLIGKDGGVKTQTQNFDLASLFATIDSMPMRRQEMQP
jgi:hypothetical protein